MRAKPDRLTGPAPRLARAGFFVARATRDAAVKHEVTVSWGMSRCTNCSRSIRLLHARPSARRSTGGAAEREAVEQATACAWTRVAGPYRRGATQLRDLDLEVQSLQQKRAKVEAYLYGGCIRNLKTRIDKR